MSPETAEQLWRELLGKLEADVRHARAGEPLEDWLPPLGMPPLPATLMSRALALLEAQAELQASVTADRDHITRALTRRRRLAERAAHSLPVYLDALS